MKKIIGIIVLCFCLSFVVFGSALSEQLKGSEDSINLIIDYLEKGKTEEALNSIDELSGALSELKRDITSEVIASGESIPVNFSDPDLEEDIREAIGKPTEEIYPEDLIILGRLESNGLYSLEGIQYCENLIHLWSQSGSLTDISLLRNLINLEELFIQNNKIKDVSPLKNLKNLKELWLSSNEYILVDLSPLLELPKLKYLRLNGTLVKDQESLNQLIANGVRVVQ